MDKVVYLVTIPFTDNTRMVASCQLPIVVDSIDATNCMTIEDEQTVVTDIAKSNIETLMKYGDMPEDAADEYAKELYYQTNAVPGEEYDVDYSSEYHVFAITIAINTEVPNGHQERR